MMRGDAPRMTRGGGGEAAFERLVARADERELRSGGRDRRQRVEQEVHAFLPRQAADDAEHERSPDRDRGRSAPAALALFAARARGASRRSAPADADRSPDSTRASSMPLRMPVSTPRALAQQPVEPHAVLGRADLRGVGRRHRGDAVGKREPRFEIADRAVIFDAVDRVGVRRQADPSRRSSRGNWPWNDRLCTVITVPGRGAPPIVEQRRHEARLPVVRVHDVGREARDGAAARSRRRRAASAAKRSPLSGHSCPSGPTYGLPGRAYRCGASSTKRSRPRGCARRGAAPARRAAARTCGRRRRRCSAAQHRGIARARSVRVAMFSRASAGGSAPTTSARPPVLTSGKISDATARTCRRRI